MSQGPEQFNPNHRLILAADTVKPEIILGVLASEELSQNIHGIKVTSDMCGRHDDYQQIRNAASKRSAAVIADLQLAGLGADMAESLRTVWRRCNPDIVTIARGVTTTEIRELLTRTPIEPQSLLLTGILPELILSEVIDAPTDHESPAEAEAYLRSNALLHTRRRLHVSDQIGSFGVWGAATFSAARTGTLFATTNYVGSGISLDGRPYRRSPNPQIIDGTSPEDSIINGCTHLLIGHILAEVDTLRQAGDRITHIREGIEAGFNRLQPQDNANALAI